MFELVHFRGADKIIKEKKMANGVKQLMEYLQDCLYGTRVQRRTYASGIKEMDWRQEGDLNILMEDDTFIRVSKIVWPYDGNFPAMNIYKMPC